MKRAQIETAVHVVLIVGFAAVDFLLFHDVLKPGEVIPPVDWMVGALSALVFASSAIAITRPGPRHLLT